MVARPSELLLLLLFLVMFVVVWVCFVIWYLF
jgi:hypothetical protein